MTERPVDQSDHIELTRLVTEICWRIDNSAADTVHELFVDGGELTLGPTTARGLPEIAEWGRARVTADVRSRHVCTNMRFVLSEDNNALGSTLLTVYLVDQATADPTVPAAVAEYHDRFIRTADGWRFLSRRAAVDFSR